MITVFFQSVLNYFPIAKCTLFFAARKFYHSYHPCTFLFSIDFYIYIYCREFNAEFNKLMKTVGHPARFPEKSCWAHPPLSTILTLFGYFHTLTYQVLKLYQHTKLLVVYVLGINSMSLHKGSHKMCYTILASISSRCNWNSIVLRPHLLIYKSSF